MPKLLHEFFSSLKPSQFKNNKLSSLICNEYTWIKTYWQWKFVAYVLFVKNNPLKSKSKTLSAGLFHKLCLTEMTKALETLVMLFIAFLRQTYYSFVTYIFLHLANTSCSPFCSYSFSWEKLQDKKKITHLWFFISEMLLFNGLLFLLTNSIYRLMYKVIRIASSYSLREKVKYLFS